MRALLSWRTGAGHGENRATVVTVGWIRCHRLLEGAILGYSGVLGFGLKSQHSRRADTAKWRVAILGLGHWYSAYNLARALPEYPKAELVAAAWHDRAQLDAFTGTFGVHGLHRLRRAPRARAASTSSTRGAGCRARAPDDLPPRAGKHILLGKPMAMTVDEADRMVEAVEAAGVVCFPFQGIMRLRVRRSEGAHRHGRDRRHCISSTRRAAGRSPRTGLNSGKPGWFADPRHVPGRRVHRRGHLLDRPVRVADRERDRAGRGAASRTSCTRTSRSRTGAWRRSRAPTASSRRSRRRGRSTRRGRRGPSPKQNAVVRLEVVGTRGEIIDQWFRSPGRAVLAAGAADWVFERQPEPPSFAPPTPFPLYHLIECLENEKPRRLRRFRTRGDRSTVGAGRVPVGEGGTGSSNSVTRD